MTEQPTRKLRYISPEEIFPNPENPRLIFRQEEMESLLVSIDRVGVQVPITVYQDRGNYYLLDGERRWRCAKKLNLKNVPALVQEKPTELSNLLLMYNIHALREQWDYFTIASKIERIMVLHREEHGYQPNEIELSQITGLTRGAIRRCHHLLGLPPRFKEMLLQELERPKSQQKLTEDFFIEMEKSLKSVTRRIPEYSNHIEEIRDTLVSKYRSGVITAITDFRQLSKIASAVDSLGVAHKRARHSLDKVFDPRQSVGIKEAYEETVEFAYDEKKASRNIESLVVFFDDIIEEDRSSELDSEFIANLRILYDRLRMLLEVVP